MVQAKFTPILLGSDINVYGMARSFNEAYGIKVQAWAASQLAATRYSKIVDVEVHEGFEEDPGFMNVMKQKIEEYKNHPEPVILIACGDGYAELLAKHKDELKDTFVVPYIDYDLLEKLISKEGFYEIAEKYGLPYPHTKIVTMDDYKAENYLNLPFDYPVELKPEDPVSWLNCQFEGRKKAFTIHDEAGGLIYNQSITVLQFLLVLIVWTLVVFILKFGRERSNWIRNLIDGKPVQVIKNGHVLVGNCMKAGISANELMFRLRSRGIYSVEKVKNCIFEQNGQLTIIENDEDNIRFPIISDGQINEDVLDLIHKSNAWLEQEVTKAGYNSPDDVFLGEYINGQLRLVGYSEK